MTLLTLVQGACDIVSVPRPSTVAGGTDQTVRTMMALAQREGKALARRWTWQALRKEHTFTTLAQSAQTSAVPSDFDRMLAGTFWNRDDQEVVVGPLTPGEWQAMVATVAQPIDNAFAFRDGGIIVYPNPTAGQTWAYEYMSKNWCESSGGTGQAAWAADSDVGVLDEELMMLGLVWRFLQSRGLDYAEHMRTYEIEVLQAIQRDGARRTARLAGENDMYSPRHATPPEGSWNL